MNDAAGALAGPAKTLPHPGARPDRAAAAWAMLLSLGSAAAGLALAWHYPIGPRWVCLLFAAAVAASARWPRSWLVWLPALLPVVGFAPWTGWIIFEELDLMVLAAAAGGYAWRALRLIHAAPTRAPARLSEVLVLAFIVLWGVANAWATWRGIEDAGGWHFGWFQGYREPMNAVHLGKSYFLAALLMPLWRQLQADEDGQARHSTADLLRCGLVAGFAASCLSVTWERSAFTGLLNMSSDYRATGPFWEMHVGGAALDAALAIGMPFALTALLLARRHWTRGAALAVALLGLYACAATFSRIVYWTLPLAGGLAWWLQRRQGAASARSDGSAAKASPSVLGPGLTALALTALYAALCSLMFGSSGYRGMLALLGDMVLLMLWRAAWRKPGPGWLWLGLGLGLGLAMGLGFALLPLAAIVPKGPYLAHGVLVIGGAFLLSPWLARRTAPQGRSMLGLACLVAALGSTVAVASHWGGPPALAAAWPAALTLLLATLLSPLLPDSAWPTSGSRQGELLLLLAAASLFTAVFGGGAYMAERWASTTADAGQRGAHMRDSMAMLHGTTEKVLGKGLGRYADNYALGAAEGQRPGDFRLIEQDGQAYLAAIAGTHVQGWGELLRMSQRIRTPSGPAQLTLRLRTAQPLELHSEVCLKHLLYNGQCIGGNIKVAATDGQWRTLRLTLAGQPLVDPGAWFIPPQAVFSIATESALARAEIDDLALTDGDGTNLLHNGGFDQGLAHWLVSSDRNHLPWHAKNLAVHQYVSQGLVGLLLLGVGTLAALWRLLLGRAREHPLAPAVAGALLGVHGVGLVDSVLDIPRIAFLFYFLLLLALGLPSAQSNRLRHRPGGSGARLARVDNLAPKQPAAAASNGG